MKRLFMIICCIFLLAGPALGDTIAALALEGGNGTSIATWTGNNNRWNTIPDSIWPLGVSSSPGGPLLNSTVDTSIPALPFGTYYLYAEPNPPGWETIPYLISIFPATPLYQSKLFSLLPGTMGPGPAGPGLRAILTSSWVGPQALPTWWDQVIWAVMESTITT
jgi:hypothetical protein